MTKPLYVPILKYKMGERLAVHDLTTEIKRKMQPLFCIMDTSEPDALANSFLKAWGSELPFYIDFHPTASGNRERYIKAFFVQAKKLNLHTIPVVQVDYEKAYLTEMKKAIALMGFGYAIRITEQDTDDVNSSIKKLHKVMDIEYNNIDVIIDIGQIPRSNEMTKAFSTIVNHLLSVLKQNDFRKVIFSGGSFPDILTGIPKNRITNLQRNEWIVWNSIHKKYPNVLFGDYGIDDPNVAQGDRFTIVPTIRYTSGDNWAIIRGGYDSRKPYDFTQFHKLSQMLIKEKKIYCGSDFSWGDNRIKECADRTCTGADSCNHGNLTSWVRIGTNHHLTYVVNQLSNLF